MTLFSAHFVVQKKFHYKIMLLTPVCKAVNKMFQIFQESIFTEPFCDPVPPVMCLKSAMGITQTL